MINNINKKYNDMLYDTRPVKFSDFISNKYNIVHKKLYEQALKKYVNEWLNAEEEIGDKKYINSEFTKNISSYEEFIDNAIILEIPNNEYWQPSKCRIITKTLPNLQWTVDLTPYWNNYQAKENKKIENIKLSNENINDSEIIKFNYITGKATLYSENTDKEYDVDFDYLDGNTNKVSESMMLKETFGYKINN